MALAIRLRRMGRKKKPFYRVIVADKREPRQGRLVDDLGYYNPMTDPAQVQINEEKALIWLKNGAEPTETARSLLSKAGILKKFHESRVAEDEENLQGQSPEEDKEEDEAKAGEQSDSE